MSLSSTAPITGPAPNPALNQLQSGVTTPAKPADGPASGGAPAALAGPSTFNVLAAPATAGPTATGGAAASGGSPAGSGADAQQPGAGKTTQSGSNDAVANDVSATLTSVSASTDSAPGSSSTTAPNGTASTQPITSQSLQTANDNYGHLNAYLSVYA